jgi:hypothetical protein
MNVSIGCVATSFIVLCLHVLELELASFNLDLERSTNS